MAQQNRLEQFGDLRVLNDLVVRSCGAYTHEDAFKIEAGFAYSLALMYYEDQMFEKRFAKQMKLLQETNKPRK